MRSGLRENLSGPPRENYSGVDSIEGAAKIVALSMLRKGEQLPGVGTEASRIKRLVRGYKKRYLT